MKRDELIILARNALLGSCTVLPVEKYLFLEWGKNVLEEANFQKLKVLEILYRYNLCILHVHIAAVQYTSQSLPSCFILWYYEQLTKCAFKLKQKKELCFSIDSPGAFYFCVLDVEIEARFKNN